MTYFPLRPIVAAMLGSGLGLFIAPGLAHAQSQPAAASAEQPIQRVETIGQRERYATPTTSSATRSQMPPEQVPQSVVSISRDLIDDQVSATLSDVLRNASSVNQIDPRDANNVVFKIRGFHAATVVDGVAMPGYFADQEALASVEQIDVLKGPAGGLFGASQGMGSYGNLGGTIAITTRAARSDTTVRDLGLRLGSQQDMGLSLDVNQPLGAGLAVRFIGEHGQSDSESKGVFFRRTAFNPSLSWQPNADSQVVLRLRSLENTTVDYSGLPRTGTLDTTTLTLPRSTNIVSAQQPDTTQKASGLNLQWTQRLNNDWAFQLVAAYNQAEVDQRGVWLVDAAPMMGGDMFACMYFGTAAAGPGANVMCGARMWDRFKTTTVSPSLSGKLRTGAVNHNLQFGVDHERTEDDAFMLYSNMLGPVSMDPVTLPSATYPAWSEPMAPSTPDQRNRYTATVAYMQDQIDFQNWHVLGSLRYSDIKITDVNAAWMIDNRSHNTKLTPRLGAVLDIAPKVSAFAGYSEGIKVPTISIFSSPPKAETSVQQEVGLKLSGWAGLTATLAWFDLQRRNAVVADPAMPGMSIQNGLHRSRGVDLDVRWQATRNVTVMGNLSALKARVEEDTTSSMAGKQLFNVPERSARLATHVELGAGLSAGLGVNHHGQIAGNSLNTYFTPAATIWDAQLAYKAGPGRYALAVDNLLNHHYYLPSAYFSGGQVTPNKPLSVRASAQFSF